MTTMWMVRGDSGRLYEDFLERKIAALGWWELLEARPGMPREELARIYSAKRPEFRKGTIWSGAAQVWRFINEVQIGDHVVTYNPSTRRYLVGTIKGPSAPSPETSKDGMSVLRPVEWHGEIDRDLLTAKAKNSLGSSMTFFRVPDSSATEVLAAQRGMVDAPTPTRPPQLVQPGEDAEDEPDDEQNLFEDTEARALEFLKDRISRLDWSQMQDLIAGILRAMGYKTRIAKPGADRGADIVASPDGLGFENPRIVVEVKHRSGQMGSKEVRSFLGGRHKDDRGLYVSTGGFTKDARYEGDRAGIPVTLWGLDDVVRTLIEYYEQLDNETRQLVPLKKIYWPA